MPNLVGLIHTCNLNVLSIFSTRKIAIFGCSRFNLLQRHIYKWSLDWNSAFQPIFWSDTCLEKVYKASVLSLVDYHNVIILIHILRVNYLYTMSYIGGTSRRQEIRMTHQRTYQPFSCELRLFGATSCVIYHKVKDFFELLILKSMLEFNRNVTFFL